jgi:hypothetical protein
MLYRGHTVSPPLEFTDKPFHQRGLARLRLAHYGNNRKHFTDLSFPEIIFLFETAEKEVQATSCWGSGGVPRL